jgi:hypothetical protein
MVEITALWLPILLSAVIVFVVSSIIHTVLPVHKNDYKKLPDEEKVMDAIRAAGVTPGTYHFPRCESHKDMKTPEYQEKLKRGPNGILTLVPSGPPNMAKYLTCWFLYSVAIGVFVAYVAGRTLAPGTHYLAVFRIAGTVAFLCYAMAHTHNSIWKGEPWGNTFKFYLDGLIYGLLTAGVFGWLWPKA